MLYNFIGEITMRNKKITNVLNLLNLYIINNCVRYLNEFEITGSQIRSRKEKRIWHVMVVNDRCTHTTFLLQFFSCTWKWIDWDTQRIRNAHVFTNKHSSCTRAMSLIRYDFDLELNDYVYFVFHLLLWKEYIVSRLHSKLFVCTCAYVYCMWIDWRNRCCCCCFHRWFCPLS